MRDVASLNTPRLFVEPDLVYDATVRLSSGQAHYLGAVMRRRVGDTLRLFNGRDGEWSATITVLEHGRAQARLDALLRVQQHGAELLLAFAVIRRDSCEFAVQKATELGVTVLQPVLTERSQGQRQHQGQRTNAVRMTAIAIEAAEQSERLTVPRIAPPCSLRDLLAGWPPDRPLAVAIERTGFKHSVLRADALLVGPEGGFSPRELDEATGRPFVLPMCLGPTVLRAETAAIVGLTLLLAGREEVRCPSSPLPI